MQQYLFKRFIGALFTLWVVSIVVFGIMRYIPGDPVVALTGEAQITPEYRAELEHQLGLHQPIVVQYLKWIKGVLTGDLGISVATKQAVTTRLKQAIPVTLEVAILATIAGSLAGVVIGTLSALDRNSPVDYGSRLLVVLGISIPEFVLATLIVFFLAQQIGWLPSLKYSSLTSNFGRNLSQIALPVALLGIRFTAIIARMCRSSVLDTMSSEYVRTAHAKGLRKLVVVMRHILPNALISVITVAGLQFATLLGGAVVVEQIFNLPGMGRLTLTSAVQRDFTMVQAGVLAFAVATVLINLVVDCSYAVIDPRLRKAV